MPTQIKMLDQLFQNSLEIMQSWFRTLAEQVPKPRKKAFRNGIVYRYTEKSAHQAIIQKLARVVSGLGAAQILLEHGFVQEQAALQRMLDEFQEDVRFIAQGLIANELTELHQRYLNAFYEEEFDKPDDPVGSTQKRPMIPRKKIQAHIAHTGEKELNLSRGIDLSKTLSKTYSGFVHGASPHIMDMYGGSPPKFHISGMLGTPRMDEHREDLCNYFYRGILAFGFAAKAFEDHFLLESITRYLNNFEKWFHARGGVLPGVGI